MLSHHSAVRMSWQHLIPHLTDEFLVEPTGDPYYSLYQAAMCHVGTPSLSPHVCAHLRDYTISGEHPCLRELGTLLADASGLSTGSLSEPPRTALLDFLLLGVHFVASINLSVADDPLRYFCAVCHVWRSQQSQESEHFRTAEFLDTIVAVWENECRTRTSTETGSMEV